MVGKLSGGCQARRRRLESDDCQLLTYSLRGGTSGYSTRRDGYDVVAAMLYIEMWAERWRIIIILMIIIDEAEGLVSFW